MRHWILGTTAFAAVAIAAQAQAQSTTIAADAAAFGARAAVAAADLSPDSSSVLYLTPGPGPKTFAVVTNLVSGQSATMVAADGNPETLRWCHYVSGSRAVCRIRGAVRNIDHLEGFGRLVALDSNGGNAKLLGQVGTVYDARLRQFDGSIVDWLNGTDATVLMSRDYIPEQGRIGSNISRTKNGLGVDMVDTATLKSKGVVPPRENASAYMSDGRGNVRIMQLTETLTNGMLSGRTKYQYRKTGSNEWLGLVEFQDDEFAPLAVDGTTNELYALRKLNGRYALYAMALDGSGASRLVAQNPRVDIDDVIRVADGQKVIGYTYAEDKRQTVYFDPEYKSVAASLGKALPKLPLVQFIDASADGQKLLLFAGSDSDPGRYYLFDRAHKALNEAMVARPELANRTLASVKPVTIAAADGTPIPGYLTLPVGKEAKGLPAVVLPHGGPSSRDEWGFDWLAQFLAARGYAVLQPEFRGSSGYGEEFLNDNAFRNWKTAIADINASARWLAAQGVADPKKVAIVGWSYGGYAALQSAETDPSLYKAVVAIAPVTDLVQLKQNASHYTNARIVADTVGSDPAASPIRGAAKISAPVLLVHGDLDENVDYAQSQRMDAALKSAGKSSELLSFKGLDHQLDDNVARTQMLTRMGELLDRTIGH